jgi:apolipoprotein N-acyltransferase
MTRVNAASIGQDLIHAAITGRSAFISASGEFRASTDLSGSEGLSPVTDLLVPDVRIAEVSYRTGAPTLYARFGDLFAYFAIFVGVAAIAAPGESRPESWRRTQRVG